MTSALVDVITYSGDLPCCVLDHLFDNLSTESLSDMDDRNNDDVLMYPLGAIPVYGEDEKRTGI